jgi:hypothetical protein
MVHRVFLKEPEVEMLTVEMNNGWVLGKTNNGWVLGLYPSHVSQ